MPITVFTSNQPRHLRLVELLAEITDEVYVVQGANTLFPGDEPGFFKKSATMKSYFRRVMDAEKEIFGMPRFSPSNARHLVMRSGDVNKLNMDTFSPILESEYIVVFAATWIRPPLIDALIAQKAVNIHMGTSPWYRGSSCNFWALHDNRPDLVGATIHMLSSGLDNGSVLFHALPDTQPADPFVLGMKAVRSALISITERIGDGTLFDVPPVSQDSSQEIRYTRNADFTDAVAAAYLKRAMSPDAVGDALENRDLGMFVRPLVH
ncbi:MAG: methionyl-tRNA formyltransferase [Rhodospirillaceae bacterium]|jgi:hypothetical protein|nr:methionyl-tRNA formyltransferase [Rhodospirillaceae bacterium]MBT6086190.1 methionyl-tRNA formyltransferase [Rhodospirillaceae bacterium]